MLWGGDYFLQKHYIVTIIAKGIVICIPVSNHQIAGFGRLFWIFSKDNRYILLVLVLRHIQISPPNPTMYYRCLKRENQRFTFEFFYIINMKTAFLTCWWMQSTTEFEFLLRNFHICSYKLCIPRKWNYFYKMHFYFNNYWNSARTTILKKVPQKGQKGKK